MALHEAQSTFYDFMHGKYLLKRLFGIDLQEDDYIEDAYAVWRDIGNIAAAIHSYEAVVGEDMLVVLPCNCEFIESVSTGKYNIDVDGDLIISYNESSNVVNPNSFLPDIRLDNNQLLWPIQYNQLHPDGAFLDYSVINKDGAKYLQLDPRHIGYNITVIYRGIIMDDDGNPCITRKESEAIAYKINYIETQLAAYTGNDPERAKNLQLAKQTSDIKMQAAKIPEYLSQNFLDQLLASKTRHDRKVFNSSYKTIG